MDYQLNITHLYPDLLNLYGDKGNIEALKRRLLWRGINANVSICTAKDNGIDFENTDIIFLGGGTDRETEIALKLLTANKEKLKSFVENGGTLIAACGGYELLGKYFQTADGKIDALGILDISTDIPNDGSRLIGDIIIENPELGKIVGFENHLGRMNIGSYTPLGKVNVGFGNNGKDGFEGIIYKNLIGTYLHGPVLPKNPKLCDYILTKALKHKYSKFSELSPLDDTLENSAKDYIISTFGK